MGGDNSRFFLEGFPETLCEEPRVAAHRPPTRGDTDARLVRRVIVPEPWNGVDLYPQRPDGAPYPDVLPSVLVVDDDDQCRRVPLNYLELTPY